MSRRTAAGLILALALALPASASGQAPYSIPPDNPYLGTAGARAEIYLYGMRNPYRWSFDRANGDIYVGDVGGINEEITYLPAARAAGSNLGWDCLSGTTPTDEPCFPPRYAGPAFQYPSSSDVVIGGYVVRDPTLPGFQGRYLFGRFASGEISMLGAGASGPSVNTGVDIDGVSGFGEDGAGHLYAVSLTGGTLHRFVQSGSALRTTSSGGFTQPVALAAPAGDPIRLFVVEKAGQVKLRAGSGVSVFLDIRDQVADSGEQGLLALAVAPDYATSGRVFVYYTTNAGDLQLDEYRSTASGPERADPATRRPLLTIRHPVEENHNGGQLLFGPDRRLYLSTGDGGNQGDPENDARSLGSLLGKMLRIDVGVSAPPVTPPAAPAPAPPAARDRRAPRLRLSVRRRQRVLRLRGAVARVRCNEACSLRATGLLRIGERRYRLRAATTRRRSTASRRLKVRLTRRSTRALRRGLRRGRRPKVRIVVHGRDAAGNRSPGVRRVVRVRRR